MTDRSGGTVLAVAGAKGGVGKTTTALNVAADLADRDVSVVAVELDLAMANFGDFLEFEAVPEPTIHDVLADEAAPMAAVREHESGFDVVPSGTDLEGFARTDLDHLPRLLTALRAAYDVVVLDTGAGASRETIEPLEYADEALLVATPRQAALRDAGKTERLVEAVDGRVAGLVVAKVGPGARPDEATVAAHVDADLVGYVPEDPAVPAAQDDAVPVIADRPDSPAATAYRALTGRLIERTAPWLDVSVSPPPVGETAAGANQTGTAVSDGGVATGSPPDEATGGPTGPTEGAESADDDAVDSGSASDGGPASDDQGEAADESGDDADDAGSGGSAFARLWPFGN